MSTRKKSPSPRTRSPMGKDGSSPKSKARAPTQRQGKPRPNAEAERSNQPIKASPKRTSKPSARKRRSLRKAAQSEELSPPTGAPDLTTAPSLERPPMRRKPPAQTPDPLPASPPASDSAVLEEQEPSRANGEAASPMQTVVAAEGLWPTEISDEPQATSDAPDQDAFLGIGSPVLPTTEYSHEFDGTDMAAAEASDDAAPPFSGSVDAEIRKLQQRLDQLLSSRPDTNEPSDATSPEQDEKALRDKERTNSAPEELLESREAHHRWGPTGLREQASEVEPFGLDPEFEEKAQPLLSFLFERYFRTVVTGTDHLPLSGPGLLVANRSGALPFDGAMLREAVKRHQPSGRGVRWLAEDWSFYLPFLGVALNRLGAVRACPENAARLLRAGHLIGCFPEGSGGSKKLYRDRYKLKRFGRGGFVRLALASRTPIIPCAIIGAEEAYPVIHRFDNLSRVLGIDYLPITPTFPALGPIGLLPAPSRWRIAFGAPISIDDYAPEAADDHVLVGRLTERVRAAVSELLDAGLKQRKNAWL